MAVDAGEDIDSGRLDGYGRRVAGARGALVALDLPAWGLAALTDRLRAALDEDVQVRLALGRAARTAVQAIDQFTAALQPRYEATRGWDDFLGGLADRPAALRQVVLVADAGDLLVHEDRDRWRELVWALHGGPTCMGGGWTTLVLADHEANWAASAFGDVAGVEAAGRGVA